MRLDVALPCLLSVASVACVDTTGGALVHFQAAAAGPVDARVGQALEFQSGRDYHVVLERARLTLGAVYLNRAVPISGSQATSCILPGIYAGEVLGSLVVDALSPDPQFFQTTGHGTSEPAKSGELWLMGGDVNQLDDSTVILDVAGRADQGGQSYPFEGQLTISRNRAVPVRDPSQPGADPICRQRIVSPIPAGITLENGGRLIVRVDPRLWFSDVEFSQLDLVSSSPLLYRFRDTSEGQPSQALYDGMRAHTGVYRFEWKAPR